MIRFKFILFLILLPILTKSKNVRPKYGDRDHDTSPSSSPLDHLNLADSWKSPSRVISATYTGNPESGRVDHANLVINIVPRMNKKPADVDLIASQSLANAKTAEEYVSKALEMKHKYDHSTPSSSFVKYDIFEKQETKRTPTLYKSVTPRPVVAQVKDDIDYPDDIKASSDVHEYYHKPDYTLKTTTTTTYKSPEDAAAFKDLEISQSRYNPQLSSAGYDAYSGIQFDSQKAFSNAFPNQYPSKEEVFDYIEKAVKKYMHELESDGKFNSGVTAAPSAHAEIKTYYRFPSSTATPPTSTKLYSMGTHSEFFKPPKTKHRISYSTVRPITVESFTPEAIDLTLNGKKQKPIDLSALDVGQSWSHSNSDQVVAIAVPVNYRHSKPKLHFNSQTYHDINALPYAPHRGLLYDEIAPVSTVAPYSDSSNVHSPVSYKNHPVGASISFGGNSDQQESEESSKYSPQFTPSMQVVNGIPVSNPYKFSMETMNDIFDNSGSREKQPQANNNDAGYSSSPSWDPYYEPTNYKDYQQYDSYNPKYNNNPEGHGYQENYRQSDYDIPEYVLHRGVHGSDMYASASSHRPKKISSSGSHRTSHNKRSKPYRKSKSKQHRTAKRYSLHSRDLERDLTPPPAEK